MHPGKRPLSASDDIKRYWYMGETVTNTPKKYMRIPSNKVKRTPEYSSSCMPATSSPKHISTSGNGDFQKALFSNIPAKATPKVNLQSQLFTLQNPVPSITLSSPRTAPVRIYAGTSDVLSLEDLRGCDILSVSRALGEMELDQNNSFNDRMSNMATCSSVRSYQDSLSDFEKSFSDDESSYKSHSACLEDFGTRGSDKNYGLGVNREELKWYKRAASLDDLQEISSKYVDFEITL